MNTQKKINQNARSGFPSVSYAYPTLPNTANSQNIFQLENQGIQNETTSLYKNSIEQEQSYSDACEYSRQLQKEYLENNQLSENHLEMEDNNGDESPESSLSDNSKRIKKTTVKKTAQKGKKNPWNPQEDSRVLVLIQQYGEKWATISNILGNRTGKQIRDRYLNYLRPDINNNDFTQDEDEQLIELWERIGPKWSQIASHLPGRTECQVKNRYYTHIKRRLPSPSSSNRISATPKESATVSHSNQPYTICSGKQEYDFKEEEENLYGKGNRYLSSSESDYCSDPNFKDGTECISYGLPALAPRFSYDLHKAEAAKIQHFEDLKNSDFFEQTDAHLHQRMENHPIEEEHFSQPFLNSNDEIGNQDKVDRYQELLHKKKILEFMYTKIMQEITRFGPGFANIPM